MPNVYYSLFTGNLYYLFVFRPCKQTKTKSIKGVKQSLKTCRLDVRSSWRESILYNYFNFERKCSITVYLTHKINALYLKLNK